MQDLLVETIDQIIQEVLSENPDTVCDQDGIVVTCGEGPAVAFRVMRSGTSEHPEYTTVYNDQRDSGDQAMHSGIRMGYPSGASEVIRGRLWSNEKILSFYESENVVDGYRDIIEKLFDDLGEDIDKYRVDYGDSAETEGLKKWKRSSRAYKSPKIEIPPEIRKKIEDILPQFHLAAPGPEKDKLKAQLDALYKQAGIENEKEAQRNAYIKAAGEKISPFEKGGGTGMASYRGRLPAIAEDKVQLYNRTLCPDLWDENKHLDPEVRSTLLKIAFDFFTDTEVKAKVQDVQLLGSAANYNWTPESDLDVHILVDSTQLGLEPEMAEKFFRSLSGKWNLEHDIKVKGHPVELYIQDLHEENSATAVYSLVKDNWVKFPEAEKIVIDKPQIQKKYSMWVERINNAIQKRDDVSLKKILESLRNCRQAGLKKQGEFSTENLVFKILRARGFLEKLKDAYNNIYDKKMTVKDGFEPTSQGPNPEAGLGTDNGGFYRGMISKMRQLEVTQKSIKSRHPQFSVNTTDSKFEKLTLDNLKALRDKAKRFANAAQASDNQEELERAVEIYLRFNDEINRRLEYINKPIFENRYDQIWLGWVDPMTHRVIASSGEEASMHDDMFNTHPETQQLDWEDAPKWRYRKDLNTVYWWGQMPNEDVRESLDIWIEQNLHTTSPKHVRLRAVSWDQEDKDNVHYSHGTMEMEEGYGAGKREEDRLKIHNKDGSIRRWQIRSKDAPKTPKMTKEVVEVINEILDKFFPVTTQELKEGLILEAHDQQKLKKNKKPLSDEERKQVMDAGAVWHHGPNGEETPAVWKSVVNGKTWYCCNTHRAIQIKPTLKGAIKAFEFIKTTA